MLYPTELRGQITLPADVTPFFPHSPQATSTSILTSGHAEVARKTLRQWLQGPCPALPLISLATGR